MTYGQHVDWSMRSSDASRRPCSSFARQFVHGQYSRLLPCGGAHDGRMQSALLRPDALWGSRRVFCSSWLKRRLDAQGPVTGLSLTAPLLILLGLAMPAVATNPLMLTSSDVSNFIKVSRGGWLSCIATAGNDSVAVRACPVTPLRAVTNLIRHDSVRRADT